MFNEDENRSGADFTGGAPSPENTQEPRIAPENTDGVVVEPQQPKPPEPEQELRRPAGPNVYYEPWQEPVYRPAAPGQEPFSPGLHSGSYYIHQRYPVFEQPPVKKKKTFWAGLVKAVCLVLVCALAAGGTTYGVIQLSGGGNRQVIVGSGNGSASDNDAAASSSPGGSSATNLTASGAVMSAENIYDMAVNQVVGVNSEDKTSNVFGQATNAAVSGSGFVISTDGYIVTNYHVISYAVEQGFTLTVMMHDGKSYPAKVVGYDQDNDLAVIKIDATGLNAATFGTNKDMKVGDAVYAVGNPLGELTYTMTSGIVSALDRVITEEDGTGINMFQIDAAVNPGNSGGPVYNDKGEVLGIVSAKYSSTGIEGLGFAIPIDDASGIISELISNGRVTGKPSIGVTVETVSSTAAQYYKMVAGAYVDSVQSGSAADKAGIKVGDIIVKLGNTAVTDVGSLKTAKNMFKAGDTTTIVVNRQGQEQTLNITFDEQGVTATAIQPQPGFGAQDRNDS
ncbi:serine protease Do [Sporobacter termitidis DSM 10068]|uniref:Serine protease Do n=1 Tax=Sporobacter termitidis DSM 10068 TaxID=1123282 RepID=A0A1M5VES5_9FIRM|nr:trypsin-like peptidase domain-containing protein [Sporobacter termitidis]SHH73604.1 serine protease Do [Sporobacter termitidis DSM 10068]